MTPVEILRKARDHIAQPGMWFQGGFAPHGVNGAMNGEPCCAMGAVRWAVGWDGYHAGHESRGDEWLDKAAWEISGNGFVNAFNDAPGRTQSEVVALFDRAIELAEREATP